MQPSGTRDDAVYDDVPIPAAKVVGPAAIVRKLEIGFARVPKHEHHLHLMIAEGDAVITEHTEDWCFAPDHVVSLPFVSVQHIADGRIILWKDYWDFQTLMGAAPAAWHERLDTANLSWVVDVTGRA